MLDALCRDDGSPTALLHAPINLPYSPYLHRARAGNYFTDVLQY